MGKDHIWDSTQWDRKIRPNLCPYIVFARRWSLPIYGLCPGGGGGENPREIPREITREITREIPRENPREGNSQGKSQGNSQYY